MSSRSRSLPPFLNPTASKTERDPVLREEHFTPLWDHYERYVRSLVGRSLGTVPLHRAEELAGRCGLHRRLLAGVGSVRRTLRNSANGVIDELAQEVAIALLKAIRRGSVDPQHGLRACAPVVKAWFCRTAYLITKGAVAEPALLVFAASAPEVQGNDGEESDGYSFEARSKADLRIPA